ncbi:MAG: metallophosphoesterase [Nanoarchaeota archaeon]
MDNRELLKFCLEKGLLLDTEVLNLLSEVSDVESAKLILEKIKNHTGQRIITKKVFDSNRKKVSEFFLTLPPQNQQSLERLKIKLGLSIEISKEITKEIISESEIGEKVYQIQSPIGTNVGNVRIVSQNFFTNKKLEVGDFVSYFRNRFVEMRNVLQERVELSNLVSIDKMSGNRQGISLIGLVSGKRTTKNKNVIFDIEDLTGKVKVLVNQNNSELCKLAEDVALDSVIGIKGSGSKEFFFASDIIFPDTILHERKKSDSDENVLFISDLHFGSKKFLESNFLKFIDYLNGKVPNTPEVDKIKYLFIGGDVVTGVGNYPNQERDLLIGDLEEQFSGVAELLNKIKRDIKIIISPGNHDGVRVMEPQPIFDEKYAWPLHNLKNVILTENPCNVNIGATKNFSGFDILTYHGFSFPYYASTVPRLMVEKAMNTPEKIMKYLLLNRHLAPTHASTQYFPSEKDTHFIKNIPDIFFAGHTHKSAISYYNNILVISGSSWEEKTPYQEKFGNEPDHCKVPMFNLKTRAVKILDFE